MILYILNVYYFVISNIKKRFTVLCKPLNAFFVNIFHFYFCFVNFTSSSDVCLIFKNIDKTNIAIILNYFFCYDKI